MVRREFFKITAALAGVFSTGRKADATQTPVPALAGDQKPLDLAYIHKWIDPGAVAITAPDQSVPAHWQGYLSPDHAVRFRYMASELALIEPILPQTARAFRDVTRDAFLVRLSERKGERRHARVFNGIGTFDSAPQSKLYSFLSYSVSQIVMAEEKNRIFLQRSPEALSRLYRTLFDGIVDVWGNGLLPLQLMDTVAAHAQSYGEADWYDDFVAKTNPAFVYETIANGGGITGLIDLNDASVAHAPAPAAIWTDAKEPQLVFADFWEFNDTLLAIVISGR